MDAEQLALYILLEMRTLLITALLLPALASAQPSSLPTLGRITGQLTYPSDYFPEDMKVTAVPVAGKGCSYSTRKTRGQQYSLSLPAGDYYVYATSKDMPGYKAYYTKFVTCGLRYGCPSHAKIVAHVKTGATTARIDPEDWYLPDPHPVADSLGQ